MQSLLKSQPTRKQNVGQEPGTRGNCQRLSLVTCFCRQAQPHHKGSTACHRGSDSGTMLSEEPVRDFLNLNLNGHTMYHTVHSMTHCTVVLKTTEPGEHVWGPPTLEPKETFASYKLFVSVFCHTTKWFVIAEFWSLKSVMKQSAGLAPEDCGGRPSSGHLLAFTPSFQCGCECPVSLPL